MKNSNSKRSTTVDFIFYPGIENKLRDRIELLLEETILVQKSKDITETPVKAILTPHAGWVHCDKIMADAYAAVKNRDIETVVILSRVHREPKKMVFLPQFRSFNTPLGELVVDYPTLENLANNSKIFEFDNIPHLEEHSIEVQLPFIKYLWPDAKIVPILTGKPSVSLINQLSSSLSIVLKDKLEKTLFIISSSSSSYDTPEKTRKETDRFISLLNNKDEWADILNRKEIGACSADCLLAVIKVYNNKVSIDMLKMDYGQTLDPEKKQVCFGAFLLR